MRTAALVKQIPRFDAMALGDDGRLVREGLELEMSAYCRRAVAKGVELAGSSGGTCTVITLGPESASDVLREALAWGADDAVLVSDRAFAGSDTLATARALAAVLEREGPFDLVLVGRNSLDADTGQVGPELAQLLGLPFVTAARELAVADDGTVAVRSEEDDGYSERRLRLPALISTAERLCEPCKVDAAGRAQVDPARIRRVTAHDLGPGPWGQDASGTYVGEVRVLDVGRARRVLEGKVEDQVDEAVRLLVDRSALSRDVTHGQSPTLVATEGDRTILVAVEPGRPGVTRELLGAANRLAVDAGATVVAVHLGDPPAKQLSGWGADEAVLLAGATAATDLVEEDVAAGLRQLLHEHPPWAVLLPGTTWGREVGSRVAAALGAGLTGDAIDLEVSPVVTTGEPQLLAWKPAFGGRLVAAIYCSTPVQLATVRPGVLLAPGPRPPAALPERVVTVAPAGRVRVVSSTRDDDVEALAAASRIVGVGTGVAPEEYSQLDDLLEVLDAELGATRKVTDRAWLPRARQIGITGRSVAPRLYVALGLAGKFNHMVGVRAAGTILAINTDTQAPLWDHCDIGIVADWHDAVPLLTDRLRGLVP